MRSKQKTLLLFPGLQNCCCVKSLHIARSGAFAIKCATRAHASRSRKRLRSKERRNGERRGFPRRRCDLIADATANPRSPVKSALTPIQ